VNACRDQNPGNEWPEIPAETHYLASYQERAVCGDWMVETVGFELATPHPWLSSFDHIFGHAGLTNLDALMPLNDKTPSLFLEAILSWGGAISAAATFVVVVSCLSAVFKSKFRTISQQRKERNK
jgi:hypothetical protein